MTGAFGQPDPGGEFIDIDAADYPLTIELFRDDTGACVERMIIPEPGALQIKPWSHILGGVHITARVTTARGNVQDA
jgi:hypothetical protein